MIKVVETTLDNKVKVDTRAIIERARQEVRDELTNKAVSSLKLKYKDLEKAQTIVENIKREIEDLELSIEQGNF